VPGQVGVGIVLVLGGAALALMLKQISYSEGYRARKRSFYQINQDVEGNVLRWAAQMMGFVLIGIGLIAIIQPFLR
jgi:hypothetical protein